MKNNKTKLIMISYLFMIMIFIAAPTFSQAKAVTLPAPVKVRAKSCQEKRLKLTWKKVKGASGYQIYRYKATAKKFVKTATVGKKNLLWKSGKTPKKQTYKIRAYKKKGSKKTYSPFSYEVTAIPYKKMAKKVNAGRVKVSRYRVSLSSYEGKKVSAQVKPSRHAKNKKSKVYDKTIRWTSTNPSIAKVDQKGNITAQGKSGICKVYARAHNGDSDWLWVKVTAYARPKKFDDMDVMQEDMVKLIQLHGEDLKDIADFFEKNKAVYNKEKHEIKFSLDSGRNHVVTENTQGKIDYKKIEKQLYQVLDSFPGFMEINYDSYGINFVLNSGDGGGEYVELIFLFQKAEWKVVKESKHYFETAPRWIYHYSAPGA